MVSCLVLQVLACLHGLLVPSVNGLENYPNLSPGLLAFMSAIVVQCNARKAHGKVFLL